MNSEKSYKKRFFNNFSWLIVLQLLGYLFSFVSLPVIIAKFGYEQAGMIFTAQSVFLTISVISNFSLPYYIPFHSKEISNSSEEFNRYWSLSLIVKIFFLFILTAATLLTVIYFFDNFSFWFLSSSLLLPKVFNINLFYNALEQNQKIFIINFTSKLLFLIILFFIPNFLLVNPAIGLTELIITVLFIFREKWKFVFVSLKDFFSFVQSTFKLFLINLFSSLRAGLIVPSVAYFLGNEAVTSYTLAEKIINVIKNLAGAGFVSFYPILNKENLKKYISHWRVLAGITAWSLLLVLLIWIGAKYLIYLLNNFEFNSTSTHVLRLLSLGIPFVFLSVPLFSLLLETRQWHWLYISAFWQLLFFLILMFFSVRQIYFLSISIVLTDAFLIVLYLWKAYGNTIFSARK